MSDILTEPPRPAFRRGLLRAFSILLMLTAILKLHFLLQESPILQTRDALFTVLTVRQTLFLGVALELSVVWFLWTRTDHRYAPWSLVWLSSMFVTYRIGLNAVDHLGYCPCLGSLSSSMPSSNAKVDLLLQASLAAMFIAGAVLALLQPRAEPEAQRLI